MAVQITQSYEYSKQQMDAMKPQDRDVDCVRSQGARTKQTTGNGDRWTHQNRSNRDRRNQRHAPNSRTTRTQRCGRCCKNKNRTGTDCPAIRQICHKCKKQNHFANMCKSSADNKSVHLVDEEDNSEFYVYTVSSLTSHRDNAVVLLSFGPKNTKLNAKIDTGSQVNIIPSSLYRQIGLHTPLSPPDTRLTSYTGDQLSVQGKDNLECKYKGTCTRADFYIVEQSNAPALLNLKTACDLGLIHLTYAIDKHISNDKESLLTEFGDVFKGTGTFSGTCSIEVRENATPVVYPVRKVPVALQERLKVELQSMTDQGIISKVTEPTNWVNALVCVEKPKTGKLRICIDPKALNENIKETVLPNARYNRHYIAAKRREIFQRARCHERVLFMQANRGVVTPDNICYAFRSLQVQPFAYGN